MQWSINIKDTVGNLRKKLEKYPDDAEFNIFCNKNLDMHVSVTDTTPQLIASFGTYNTYMTDTTEVIYEGIKDE